MQGRWRKVVAAAAASVVAALVSVPGAPGHRLVVDLQTSACQETTTARGTVALGDSITIGTSDPAWGFLGANSWFAQTVCADGSPVVYGYNAGISGNTTRQMLDRFDADVLAHDPAQVVVLGGTNDLSQGVPIADTVANIRAIATRVQRTGADVWLATIPPREDPTFRGRTGRLNAAITDLAADLGAPLLDFHTALVGDDGSFRAGLNADDLHPSEQGARVMAELALPQLG